MLLFGLILAVPAVIIAGPVFGSFISRRVPVAHPSLALVSAARAAGGRETGSAGTGSDDVDDVDLGQAAATDAGEERPLPRTTGCSRSPTWSATRRSRCRSA